MLISITFGISPVTKCYWLLLLPILYSQFKLSSKNWKENPKVRNKKNQTKMEN